MIFTKEYLLIPFRILVLTKSYKKLTLFSPKLRVGSLEMVSEVIFRNCSFGMLEDYNEMKGAPPIYNTLTIKLVRA